VDFDRARFAASLKALAERNIWIGTSSWKYDGWCGQIYECSRYEYRGKFAASRFNRGCLTEYAEVFKTVCVDAAYYKFPDRSYLDGMVSQVPEDFRFAFKVTDEITIKKFTNLPRHGMRAGKANDNFLNADLFARAFLRPCEEFKKNVGLLMFEFSHFYPSDFVRGRDFVEALDRFLVELPAGWPYGIEMRNRHFLHPDYFAMLRKHGVAHIYNSWTDMPSIAEQMQVLESRTNDDLLGARFLLKPGRKYDDAVKAFSPYRETHEKNEEARSAGAALIKQSIDALPKRGTFIYVNNRLEGNAPMTILAMMERAGLYHGADSSGVPAGSAKAGETGSLL
jgi:uncharacterized protein YecE (DUF72 family)